MEKIIPGILILFFMAMAAYCQEVKQLSNETGDWRIYRNEQYGFEIKYPSNVNFYDGEKEAQKFSTLTHNISYPCDPSDIVACFYIPITQYPNTNFEGATLAIRSLKRFNTEARCVGTVVPKVQIDGVTFSQNAGAWTEDSGHISKDVMYRTLREEGCFEITLRINTSMLENQPLRTDAVKLSKLDEDSILKELNQMLSTFRFSQSK